MPALRNIQDIPGWSAFENDILKGDALYKNQLQMTQTQIDSLKSYGLNKGLDKEVVNSIVNKEVYYLPPNNIVKQLNKQAKNNKNTNNARVNEKRITNFINSLEPSIELRPGINKIKQNYIRRKKNNNSTRSEIKKLIENNKKIKENVSILTKELNEDSNINNAIKEMGRKAIQKYRNKTTSFGMIMYKTPNSVREYIKKQKNKSNASSQKQQSKEKRIEEIKKLENENNRKSVLYDNVAMKEAEALIKKFKNPGMFSRQMKYNNAMTALSIIVNRATKRKKLLSVIRNSAKKEIIKLQLPNKNKQNFLKKINNAPNANATNTIVANAKKSVNNAAQTATNMFQEILNNRGTNGTNVNNAQEAERTINSKRQKALLTVAGAGAAAIAAKKAAQEAERKALNAKKANNERKAAQEAERKALNAKKANNEKKALPQQIPLSNIVPENVQSQINGGNRSRWGRIGKAMTAGLALSAGQKLPKQLPSKPGSSTALAIRPGSQVAVVEKPTGLKNTPKINSAPISKIQQLNTGKTPVAFSTGNNGVKTSNLSKKFTFSTNKNAKPFMIKINKKVQKYLNKGKKPESIFRLVAKEVHPNKGGTKEEMQYLQKIKKQMLEGVGEAMTPKKFLPKSNNKSPNVISKALGGAMAPKKQNKNLSNKAPERKGLIEKTINSAKKSTNFIKKLRQKAKEEKNKEEVSKVVKGITNRVIEKNRKDKSVSSGVKKVGAAMATSAAAKKVSNRVKKMRINKNLQERRRRAEEAEKDFERKKQELERKKKARIERQKKRLGINMGGKVQNKPNSEMGGEAVGVARRAARAGRGSRRKTRSQD